MTIARALFLVFTTLLLAAAAGAQENPLKSAACGQALASLRAARGSPAAAAGGDRTAAFAGAVRRRRLLDERWHAPAAGLCTSQGGVVYCP